MNPADVKALCETIKASRSSFAANEPNRDVLALLTRGDALADRVLAQLEALEHADTQRVAAGKGER